MINYQLNDEPVFQPIVGSIYDVTVQLAAVHFQLTRLFIAGNSDIRKLHIDCYGNPCTCSFDAIYLIAYCLRSS